MFFCLIVWSAGFPTGVENMGGCSKLDGDNKVHLIIKLLAISLQACKFTKLSFFTHIFQGFYLLLSSCYLLCFFLGIISWKDASLLSGREGGGRGGHF